MARTYVTADGVTLIIPDSSVSTNVVTNPQGLASTGVIALVGESDEGPQWSEEARLADNTFGPADINRVVAKYGSGRLVDAYRGAVSASASARIQGAPQRFVMVKSNQGTKALKVTDDAHGQFTAKLAGASGNSIKETIASAVDESAPSTGDFSYIPSASSSSLAARVNGGALQTLAISADTIPTALATAITGLQNLNAIGGINRLIMAGLSASNSIALAVVSGQNVNISLTAPAVFGASPVIGDTLRIPAGSVIEGGSAQNVGWYLVTAVSNTGVLARISATKITAGAPAAVSSVALSATPANDMVDYSPLRINNMSGTNKNVLTGLVGVSATVTVAGSALTFTLAASNQFAANSKVGDLFYIPSGSAYAGAGTANVGWYQVAAVSNTTSSAFITASRLSNGAPVGVSATAITNVSNISVLARQIKGVGKAMVLSDNAGSVNISTLFLGLGVTSAASWIQTVIKSASEFVKRFDFVKAVSNITESMTLGGNVSLEIGYKGTTATLTIQTVSGARRLQTTVAGGIGSNLDINLEPIATVSDLVDQLNAQPGYSAAVVSTLDGQRSPSDILDQVSAMGIAADQDSFRPGRVKRDIWDLTAGPNNIEASSVLVRYANTAVAGLPEDEGPVFLAGGARGATTALNFAQSVDAMAGVRCNFVVPLVSQDASIDAAAGQTDPSSTYTVDAANAAVRAHVIAMSTPKVKRHRLAILSKKDTFANQKSAAQQTANFRCSMAFQDIKDLNSQGSIVQFQPWMAASKAAGMQAAGFYKAIYNKALQISGVVNPSGYDDQNISDNEDAILAGLLSIAQEEDGSFVFKSDQTTYGFDNNFVYNSLQACYVADIIALSLAESVKKAFVGESVADVTANAVISFIQGKMEEFLNRKLTARSDKAPAGWKTINVNMVEDVLEIDCTVCEATSIRFAPIRLNIEGVRNSATA